jgi:hypothetical protein
VIRSVYLVELVFVFEFDSIDPYMLDRKYNSIDYRTAHHDHCFHKDYLHTVALELLYILKLVRSSNGTS